MIALLACPLIALAQPDPVQLSFEQERLRACVEQGVSWYVMFTTTAATPDQVQKKIQQSGSQPSALLDGTIAIAYRYRGQIKPLIGALFDYCGPAHAGQAHAGQAHAGPAHAGQAHGGSGAAASFKEAIFNRKSSQKAGCIPLSRFSHRRQVLAST